MHYRITACIRSQPGFVAHLLASGFPFFGLIERTLLPSVVAVTAPGVDPHTKAFEMVVMPVREHLSDCVRVSTVPKCSMKGFEQVRWQAWKTTRSAPELSVSQQLYLKRADFLSSKVPHGCWRGPPGAERAPGHRPGAHHHRHGERSRLQLLFG